MGHPRVLSRQVTAMLYSAGASARQKKMPNLPHPPKARLALPPTLSSRTQSRFLRMSVRDLLLAGGPSFTRRVASPVRAGETRGCPTFRGLKRGVSQPQKRRQSLTRAVKYIYTSRNEAARTAAGSRAPSILADCKSNCRHPARRGSSVPTGWHSRSWLCCRRENVP